MPNNCSMSMLSALATDRLPATKPDECDAQRESSLALLAAHGVILGSIWTSKQPPATTKGAAVDAGEHRRGARRRTTRKSE